MGNPMRPQAQMLRFGLIRIGWAIKFSPAGRVSHSPLRHNPQEAVVDSRVTTRTVYVFHVRSPTLAQGIDAFTVASQKDVTLAKLEHGCDPLAQRVRIHRFAA